MDFATILQVAANQGGGEASGPVYVRTAFVESGATGGTLNDPDDPYPTFTDALAALLAAYNGQSVTLAIKDDVSGSSGSINRVEIEGFTELTILGFGGVRTFDFFSLEFDGASGTSPGENGQDAVPPILNFNAITSIGTVKVSGGSGASGATGDPFYDGGSGGVGGNSIVINLLNSSVIATITGIGGNGGDGGTGGDGDESNASGSGGAGGPGGAGVTINHDATSSVTSYSFAGGAGGGGGAPGADGGVGQGNTGAAGADGSSGSYNLI